MKDRNLFFPHIVAVAALVSAALSATPAHSAAVLKTGFFAISPLGMTATTPIHDYLINGSQGALFNLKTTNECFTSSVNLPQAAKIASIAVFYKSRFDGQGTARVYRSAFSSQDVVELANRDIADTTYLRKSILLTLNPAAGLMTVNNQKYNYGFEICMQNNQFSFYGARVTYTYAVN